MRFSGGCYAEGRTYVVPIAYVYGGNVIYGHSAEGLKTRMMRKNRSVCFETDIVDDLFNWRSVIAWRDALAFLTTKPWLTAFA